MATTEKLTSLSQVYLVPSGSTGSLNGGTTYTSSAINNSQGQATDGYPFGRLTLKSYFNSAPASNSSIYVYFITSEDGGTSYEDSSPASALVRMPDAIFLLNNNNSFQQQVANCNLPVGYFKSLVYNTSSSNMLSGWSLSLLPWTPQGV